MGKRPFVFAVCGEKNTGKTTLVERLIAALTMHGFRVAAIKHDGHAFAADVPGTDSCRHRAAGAYATAVYDGEKFMVVKEEKTSADAVAQLFPEADMILLEGCKGSDYPKVQMLTAEKDQLICNQQNLVAFASDGTDAPMAGVPCYGRDDIASIAALVLREKYIRTQLSMIVLAGGLSRRMGREKADLLYGGTTFLEHQIALGRELGIRDILVSGYRGECCSVPVVTDKFCQRGPLGGLEATLEAAQHRKCLVVTVDMPRLDAAVLRGLIERSMTGGKPVTVLRHGEKTEPLLGVYDRAVAKDIRTALVEGRGGVMALLEQVGYDEYVCADNGTFGNINTQQDYAALEGEGICTPSV
ncbi:MAG: molybdopterin-guanine dinucleotide biosynthesis protein B [Oscillospiraceae bacterium]|nr:molybdopterin-guanine dinucleotide biosynthesis protein B [Oscillospiraceae bacterium]